MRVSGLAVAVTAALLTSPLVPVTGAAAAGPVPCPRPAPPAPGPTPSATPPPDPVQRAVGGARLATSGLVVPPQVSAPPKVAAASWLVADLDTGEVLGGCGPHEYATPASVQKLLLAATMLPRLDPAEEVTITAGDLDIEPGSSAVGLVAGGRYRVETLWLGLLLRSGNEVANALARLGGGPDGMAGGLRAMNEQAKLLGAYQTHAATPSGLDGPGQFTSAYDLALIARACFADGHFRQYVATREADIPAQPKQRAKGFSIDNDNQLLYHYPGALGGKTGYTDLARHTYVGAAERNGRRLVVTLLGADVIDQRGWQQGAALLDWGFALPRDASVGVLVRPGTTTASAPPASVPPQALPGGASGAEQTGRGALAGQLRSASYVVLAVGLTVLVGALIGRRRRLRTAGRGPTPRG
ncbi:D-alanyl-D-alanine carboxypeptidase [Micromonospora zingiberis]|uniref:D-alanyl-D-alanine carboxypeptidase n=1 Tax=Micromonospora zingiberis TaxID=2053011 RepID=A0A4R0GWG8_9ACTN|nr:serine hydrolase [Micromonospora zingiberis]TCC00380.1 D-alanyl-D-alanine carboxypeptidase [Micromonospora zingiberis]